MNQLALPDQLKGPWENVLILTYGANIPFFERAVWPQLGTSCRNRVILADGQQYLQAYASCADSNVARYLNQRYVFGGIGVPHAAHAKLVLLTTHGQGRMLVGSGNLSLQGYASGGELFTQYDYDPDSPDHLPAFLAIRELIEGVLAVGQVGPVAERHIRHMFESTPWLFHSSSSSWRPVRHNLKQSFLQQVQEAVDSETVRELWIISPFLDKEAIALDRLLTALKPVQATLLVQPGYTSVDRVALQQVKKRHPKLHVRTFELKKISADVHAKLYLLKLARRAICLQGSPNLSQVAMLRHGSQGNIELANLLEGPRHAFDYVIDALDIKPEITKLDEIDLSYQTPSTSTQFAGISWQLTSGEWRDDRLTIMFQGTCPALGDATLVIGDQSFALVVRRHEGQTLDIQVPKPAVELFQRPVPVAVHWSEDGHVRESNPIFVYNCLALEAELESFGEADTLKRAGALDAEDEEFEELLAQLEATLLLDRRSIWQIAGRVGEVSTEGEEDESLSISYDELDYVALRSHPRIQQYLRRGTASSRTAQTRLQIILNAITDHFQGLVDTSLGRRLGESSVLESIPLDAQDETEREEEESARETRRRSQASRLRRILRGFIRRYLRGFGSKDFQEFAGFEVMTKNYAVFSHILWHLFSKEWVEPGFLVESLLDMWVHFWGREARDGYFGTLTNEQKADALGWITELHADAYLLSSLYMSAETLNPSDWYAVDDDYDYDYSYALSQEDETQLLQLRAFLRDFLISAPLEITANVVEDAWRFVAVMYGHEPPRPSQIVRVIAELAQFETRSHFAHMICARYGFAPGCCRFDIVKAVRVGSRDSVKVNCLIVDDPKALADYESALSLLKDWMQFESLDYYRIMYPDADRSERLIFYDVPQVSGVYLHREANIDTDTGKVTVEIREWEAKIEQLRAIAVVSDERMVIPQITAPRIESNQSDSRQSKERPTR